MIKKILNKKNIYFISWIFIIIWLLNIFLVNILQNNININLYDPNPDINQAASILTETLDKQSIHNSQIEVKNNANSILDYNQNKEINTKYNNFVKTLLQKWWKVSECYNLKQDLQKDKCIKEYRTNLLTNIKTLNLDFKNYNKLLKEICNYWQVDSNSILECINKNSIDIKKINLFKCSDYYKDNKKLKMKCFDKNFQTTIWIVQKDAFMQGLINLSKQLINIDSKWRVIIRKLDSKILKEHPEYWTIFQNISPYFINNEEIEKPYIKKDKDLYNFLKEKIKYYNNFNNFNIYKYSTFKYLPKNK